MKKNNKQTIKKILQVIIWANNQIKIINDKIDKNFYLNTKLSKKVLTRANTLDLKFQKTCATIQGLLEKFAKLSHEIRLHIKDDLNYLIIKLESQFEKNIRLMNINFVSVELLCENIENEETNTNDKIWNKWVDNKIHVVRKHYQLLKINIDNYNKLKETYNKLFIKLKNM
ncbi:hypothetical protein DA803_03100 [[Mycoplasma] phocae]|uniref:Uncharacterized protein n=1 Tax=[Mycoplasma] phocae TaxID=142651 RepID=A0A2Z5IRP3_9BACT|nr:hypothetical protein [[Mycoplasma] phocae]AXE61056.1 hypothetical protein DA803_03100 [[Mycoplasma] phocae]